MSTRSKSNKRDLLRSMSQPTMSPPIQQVNEAEQSEEVKENIIEPGTSDNSNTPNPENNTTHENDHGSRDESPNTTQESELFTIKRKQKKLPKSVTHTVITPEINTNLLTEFDNIRSHLEYSRAELIESLMSDYVTLVKQTHPEWAEKAAPKGRRRR